MNKNFTDKQKKLWQNAKEYIPCGEPVTAIQIKLDTEGLFYNKWGSNQIGKKNDWLVESATGSVYTIDNESFEKTYKLYSKGRYIKFASIWVTIADHDGNIKTKEGYSHYKDGDYLVANNQNGEDPYTPPADVIKNNYVRAYNEFDMQELVGNVITLGNVKGKVCKVSWIFNDVKCKIRQNDGITKTRFYREEIIK